MRRCLLLLFLVPLSLMADALRVPLQTDTRLLPIYLTEARLADGQFAQDYVRQLWDVLAYDLNNNGRTQVSAPIVSFEQSQTQVPLKHPGQVDELRKRQIYYMVKGVVNEGKLSAVVFSLGGNRLYQAEALNLTGRLSEDRQRMHELADFIHLTLFDQPGIATSKLLYTLRRPNPAPGGEPWISEVWIADWDGKNQRQVTHENAYCVTPSFFPAAAAGYAAQHFLYVSYRTGQPKIYIGSTSEQRSQRLTYLRGNQLMPVMNPERTLIAFISDAAGSPDLFLQAFSAEAGPLGKPVQFYSYPRATQASPTFSPDGRRLAFVSNKDGSPRIYVTDVPEQGVRRTRPDVTLITRANSESVSPCWSPDGNKLAYSSRIRGTRQIWVYDFATGQEIQLTDSPGHKENPSWAPNSQHIVYNTEDGDNAELYLIDIHNKRPQKLSSGPGQKRFPSWEPRVLETI